MSVPAPEHRVHERLAALADASSQLRGLQRLSLVQRPAAPLPVVNPLPPHLDDRFGAAATKIRKSAGGSAAPDRIRSELYPVAKPPVHHFVAGTSSRHIGRVPQVRWPGA